MHSLRQSDMSQFAGTTTPDGLGPQSLSELGLGGVGVLWFLVGEGEGGAGRDACKRGVQCLGLDLFEAWL